jgi:hypothetical protein
MCTSESKINKKFTITTQDPTASHRISHPSTTRVPSSMKKNKSLLIHMLILAITNHLRYRIKSHPLNELETENTIFHKRNHLTKYDF